MIKTARMACCQQALPSRNNTLPIIVDNIPARAIVDILPDTMTRLAALPTVVGVKDATTDLARPAMERQHIQKVFF